MSWFDSLTNTNLKTAASQAIADNSVSYNEILGILETAATGGISTSEFADLKILYDNCKGVFASSYLTYITEAVVSGPGNEKWWGGATNVASVVSLGNMTAGTSELNATRLIGKWFKGLDLPMPVAGGDTAAGISAQYVASYTLGTGSLFASGAAASDVKQGYAGTCYLVASFGAIANANASYITNAFIDNGNGTYGVKFYFGGKPVYTTIDKSVPTYSGNIAFSGNSSKSVTGELWVSLLEKAYAQLNTQYDLDGTNVKEGSYQGIEGGFAYSIKQLTGLNYKYYSSYYNGIPDDFDSGEFYSSSSSTYKQTIINALNAGSVGWLGSWGATTGSNGKKEFVAGHAYMLLGYNSSTDKFIIRNPWGDTTSGNYNPQFEASIGTFWNSSVKAIVALSDSTVVDPSYNYTITSSAGSAGSAVAEGGAVTFTITRSGSGVASTVYLMTRNGTAGVSDYAALAKTAVTFAANETSKTVTVDTFADTPTEPTEYFYLALYKNAADANYASYGTAYVKDQAVANYNYSIISSAGSPTNAVAEGGTITFTVSRSGTGAASTVYVSTRNGSAGASDYAALTKAAVTFAPYETSKKITVSTFTDSLTDGTEGFYLDLFKLYTNSTASNSATGYIKDSAAINYSYSIASPANLSANAVTEGGTVTFTITRNSSGTESSVYLSTVDGTAGEDDYVGFSKKKVTFLANQTIATVQVSTSNDWWLETPEYFSLALYKNYSDTTQNTSVAAYIKDAPADAFNYTIISTAGTSANAATEGNTITFTISRSGTGSASTVYVSTTPGSAGAGDYAAFDKTAVNFAAYETSKTITVNTYTDSLTEGTEGFYLDLFKNYSDPSYSSFGYAYIKDKTATAYNYTVTSSASYANAMTEGGAITFTITRNGSGSASTVYVTTTPGSAATTDFAALNKSAVSFAAYETTKTITVNTYTDSITEGTEGFYLDLFKNYSDTIYSTYGIAYIKDKAVTSYNYTITSAANNSLNAVTEGGAVTFTITRNGSGSASTVYVSTASGSANGTDYFEMEKAAVNFAAYETTKTITVNTYTDSATEGAEAFFLNLYKNYSDQNYSTYGYAYIKDKAAANYNYTVTSSASSFNGAITEGEAITFTITRNGSGSASTVYLTTTPGSASTSDFAALNKYELTFAAYETSKTITVNTYTDSLTEGTEGFYLDLFKNYADTTYSTYGFAYIRDKVTTNYAYTITSAASSSLNAVTEGNAVTFTITRNGSGSASTVYLTTTSGTATGSDYNTLYKSALTFESYETSKTITINTYTDSLTEGAEYFYLDLFKNYSDSSYASYSYAYIKDKTSTNYNYTISSTASNYLNAVTEGDTVTFTITRSASGSASTVYVSTSPGSAGSYDYSSLYKMAITFGAYETSKTVTVNTYTDSTSEGNEYFYLDLYKNYSDSSYSSYGQAYIKDKTIANYDYTVSSSAGSYYVAATEGNAITFTITRSGSGSASTVYVSTTQGSAGSSDYGALTKAAVTFGANETTKTITVSTYSDGVAEGTEYFYLDLFENYADSFYSTWGYGYIKDAAGANYNYTVTSPASVYSNAVAEGGAITFTITRSGSGSASTVYLSTTPGSAGSSDYTAMNKSALTFAANETTKTITVNTISDSYSEGNEYFFLDLFKNSSDAVYTSYGYAYIKDGSNGLSATAAPQAPVVEHTLKGSTSGDVLIGSAANDILVGGDGGDKLTGGAGADTFRYEDITEGGDTILDFRAAEGDKLVFVSSNFGELPIGALQANHFAANSTGSALDADSRFLFNTSNGILRYDADGTGSGAAVTIATLNVRSLQSSNIFLAAS